MEKSIQDLDDKLIEEIIYIKDKIVTDSMHLDLTEKIKIAVQIQRNRILLCSTNHKANINDLLNS